LKGEAGLWEHLSDYSLLTKLYVYYNKKFKRKNVDELKIARISKKTMHLIQETIDVKEIEEKYPEVEVDEEFIETLKKSAPRTIGGAIEIPASILVETRKHPKSPFFINLKRDIERSYENLRDRRIQTKEAMEKYVDISQRIVEWKKEEVEIGKDKYPIYETMKIVLPDLDKQSAISIINLMMNRLRNKGLLFNGWQQQREVRRRIRAETMLLLLSNLKEHKEKIDDLLDKTFEALEENT